MSKARTRLLVFFVFIAVSLAIAGASSWEKAEIVAKKSAAITFKNAVVKADVSDTEFLREKGLSGRPLLPDGTGMWFVYREDGVYSYWMPDMHFSIDIIWFDENLRVVYLQENATPESYPNVFIPTSPARYVLEVPSGFVQKNGILLGESVSASDIHLPH